MQDASDPIVVPCLQRRGKQVLIMRMLQCSTEHSKQTYFVPNYQTPTMLFSHVFFCISSILKIYIPSMFATFFFVTWNPQKCQRSSEIIVGPPLDLALRSGRRQADFLDLKDPGSHLSREGRHFIVEGPEVGDAIMAHIHQNLSVLFPNLDVNYMCI